MKMRNVVIGLAIGLVALLVVGLLLGGSLWMGNDYHHGPGMMWGSGFPGGMRSLGGGILMVLFWVLLLGLIVGSGALLLGFLNKQGAHRIQAENESLEILKRRYARGEIDSEEFERIREILLSETDG